MTTIEDRLREDAKSSATTSPAAWDDIIERRRTRLARAHRVNRSISAAFVILLCAVAVFLGTSGVAMVEDVAVTPADAAPLPPTETLEIPNEASPALAIAAWVIPWGGAIAALALVYLASPREFRAPFFLDRTERFGVAVSFAGIWAAAVLAVALIGFTAFGWQPFLWVYLEATSVLVSTALLATLFWALGNSGYRPLVLLGTFFGVAYLNFLLTGAALSREFGWLIGLSIAAFWFAVAALHIRRVGFRAAPSRLNLESLRTHSWRQKSGAAMILIGVLVIGGALSQAVVFQTHLLELAQDLDDFDPQSREDDGLFLFTNDFSPTLTTAGGADGSVEAEQAIIDRLEARGFVAVEPFSDILVRPRGDAFDGTVVEVFERVSFSAEDASAFEAIRTVRNVGYAFVIAGMLLIWSESAISRFLRGPNPWVRRPKRHEQAGWCSIGNAALLMFVFPWLEGTVLVLFGVGMFWWLGAHLLVPKPPATTEPEEEDAPAAPQGSSHD